MSQHGTPEYWKEVLNSPVVKAFSEGKTIQYRNSSTSMDWITSAYMTKMSFGIEGTEYRIKPEPVVRWCVSARGHDIFNIFNTKEEAVKEALKHRETRVFKMVEAES